MTELLDPARAVQVRLNAEGTPTQVQSPAGCQTVIRVLNRWRIECDWWRLPIAREYWRLLLENELVVECFCDLKTAEWYMERVYD